MRLLGTPVTRIAEGDLANLVANGVGESQSVEYKLALPGNSDADRKDFLADVSAMANTAGGVILYGIETVRDDATGRDTGVPSAAPGIADLNADEARQRLEAMMRSAVEPAITTQALVREVRLSSGASVIALGVARSHLAPHRVSFKGSNRIFRRSQSGNYEPEVSELRRMFLEQHEWMTEATDFVTRRVVEISNTMETDDGIHPVLCVHIVPLGRQDQVLDLRGRCEELGSAFPPLHGSGYGWEYNADGVRVFTPARGERLFSYVQIFRNGIVEFASLGFGAPQRGERRQQDLYGEAILGRLLLRLPEAVTRVREKLLVEPPYAVFVCIANLRQARLVVESTRYWNATIHPIEPACLRLPPQVIEDPTTTSRDDVCRMLDVLWQSAGYPEAPRPTTP